jgi:hypothetical protein
MGREVASGETILLYIEVYDNEIDGNRALKNADSIPTVSIFDQFNDPRDPVTEEGDAIVLNAVATQITTGIYRYSYTVPSGQITGFWFDRWKVIIDGIESTAVMQFLVSGNDEGTTPLIDNCVVQITIDDSVTDIDGNSLANDYEFYFLTPFSPMYSDPVRLRLEMGIWVNEISDETLTLMLYEASIAADDITPAGINIFEPLYSHARTRWVTCNAAMRLLGLPLNQGGMTKSLGDLLVKRDAANFGDMLKHLHEECGKWEAVVNAGGNIGPGESLGPIAVVKGEFDPDRRAIGRRWNSSVSALPYANNKLRRSGGRLYEFQHDPAIDSDGDSSDGGSNTS